MLGICDRVISLSQYSFLESLKSHLRFQYLSESSTTTSTSEVYQLFSSTCHYSRYAELHLLCVASARSRGTVRKCSIPLHFFSNPTEKNRVRVLTTLLVVNSVSFCPSPTFFFPVQLKKAEFFR